MEKFHIAAATALWLGILTSISPCPLASNITAVSFVSRRVGSPKLVFFAGFLYTAGRMAAYIAVGFLIVGAAFSVPGVANFLQKYMNAALGPILIVAGVILFEILPLKTFGFSPGEKFSSRMEKSGVWGAALLGFLFALSFCPISAGLYFGSLIPLSVKFHSSVLFPALYGIGTSIPVLIFAAVIAWSTGAIGKYFDWLTRIEKILRRVTAAVFLTVGVYFVLIYNFKIAF